MTKWQIKYDHGKDGYVWSAYRYFTNQGVRYRYNHEANTIEKWSEMEVFWGDGFTWQPLYIAKYALALKEACSAWINNNGYAGLSLQEFIDRIDIKYEII